VEMVADTHNFALARQTAVGRYMQPEAASNTRSTHAAVWVVACTHTVGPRIPRLSPTIPFHPNGGPLPEAEGQTDTAADTQHRTRDTALVPAETQGRQDRVGRHYTRPSATRRT
jgi:hypothetical protein